MLDHLTKYNAEGDKTEETEYGKTGDVKEKRYTPTMPMANAWRKTLQRI